MYQVPFPIEEIQAFIGEPPARKDSVFIIRDDLKFLSLKMHVSFAVLSLVNQTSLILNFFPTFSVSGFPPIKLMYFPILSDPP